MPGFTPGRRWQQAYYPFKKLNFGDSTMITFERAGKGLLFGCRMCGNCLLQETAFICPMECPKGLRNGPCGGSMFGKCEVFPERDCVWTKIHERSEIGALQIFDMKDKVVKIQPGPRYFEVKGQELANFHAAVSAYHKAVLSQIYRKNQ